MNTIKTLLLTTILALTTTLSNAHESHVDTSKIKLQNLMKATLDGVKNTEVVVSHVVIPANTTLPKHWHPGEEFAYIIDGSVTLWQQGKKDVLGKKGDVLKVPLKQIHTAKTGNESVVLVVFRVHEKGQPERIKAE